MAAKKDDVMQDTEAEFKRKNVYVIHDNKKIIFYSIFFIFLNQ